jgi:hypothetical protein
VNDPTRTRGVHRGNVEGVGFSLYQNTRLSRYNASSRGLGTRPSSNMRNQPNPGDAQGTCYTPPRSMGVLGSSFSTDRLAVPTWPPIAS